MKLLLKLILITCLVFAGIYAATPLWLPTIFARQLPAGWQLEELQSGYPGLAGINIDLLRMKGEPGVARVELTSSDLRFEYRGFKTDVGLISLDVYTYDSKKAPAEPLKLDDLPLPILNLTGKLPQISVKKMRVALHETTGIHDEAYRPVRLDFENLELSPRSDLAYHLASQVTIAGSPQFKGQLDVNVSPELVTATMHFPTSTDVSPWLTLEVQQEGLQATTTTHMKAVLNSESANREWLDSVLAGSTRQVFTQLGGRLEMDAIFSGQERQSIESLTLISKNLRLVSDGGTLELNAELLASHEGEDVAIELSAPASIQYQGKTTWIDGLLEQLIPELQLTHGSDTKVVSELGTGSRFSYRSGNQPSIGFGGDIKLDLISTTENLTLRSSGIQLDAGDLKKPQSTTADGLITFAWQLNAPLSYTSEDLRLEADKLSITGELKSRGGKLVSKGSGTLKQARLTTHDMFAEKIDMTWKELDLISLTGKLGTRTHGFTAEVDDKTWAGFDLDLNYALSVRNGVNGTGVVKFASGQDFPLEFTGNTETQRWNIKLSPATIRLAKLRKLLSVAHYQLPASIKLTDGYIDIEGDVRVDDEITAEFHLSGHDMGASLLKSSASEAGFTFKTGFNKTPWASGPVSIKMISLAGGVKATDFSSEFELENTGQIALKNVHAEVFDGQLKLGGVHFSDDEIEDTTIELSHINLGLLLDYAEIDGLEGTGFLDIQLPVGSDKSGFHVKDGTFSSNGPGRLAYTKEGIAGSNIGLQALENFQYKVLSGTLNYQSDGNYLLTIRLDGKNPDLYGGHPVVFNLNVNGLLPELFEAMFMTGSFEESILKQIKSR